MTFKKICIALGTFCILAAILATGLCVNAERVANLSTTGYESVLHPTICDDILIFDKNGQLGLIDNSGKVLVEPVYNDWLYPDEDGIVIFYEFADGLTINSFDIHYSPEDGVLCNTVSETINSGYNDRYEYVKSADYNINSYVYNKSGTLISYGINTYISSVDDDIIEVRTNPRSSDSELVSFRYKVEYKCISDGSVIYSNDNCISSTGFNEGLAVISEGYDDSLLLTVINSDGEIISKKDETKIFDETKYPKGFGEHHIRFFSDVHDNRVVFYFVDLPTTSTFYIYDLERDSYKKFVDRDDNFISFWYYTCNGFRQVFFNNSYKANKNNWDEEQEYVLRRVDNLDYVGKAYKGLYSSIGTDYYLIETSDGRWGLIDTYGNECGLYKDASLFVNGKALVIDDENRAYVINDKFERISEYIYGADAVDGKSIEKNGLYYLITNFDKIDGTAELSVLVNGKMVMFDQPPILENGRTLVPVRAIFEALDATVEWEGATQTVRAVKGNITITLQIGNNNMYKNGEAISLDVPAQLVGNRTLVPVRAVSEAFNCKVDWVGETQTVLISGASK